MRDESYDKINIVERYKEQIKKNSPMKKLEEELPPTPLQRVKDLVEEKSLESIIEDGELQELSKVEMKFILGSYLGNPAEFVLEKNSLRDQYLCLIENLYNTHGEVEL